MSTRDRVLAALREAGAAGASGEVLAGALGVSRVAVSKHVGVLRGLGYAIDAVPGSGYRLTSAPDAALPGEVGPLLADPLWVGIEGGLDTASTNDDARTLALGGAPEGTVVVAASQRSGRGRLGRVWQSPQGGAYFSAILRPPVAPAQAGPLALVISLGIARGLSSMGLACGLKWPNDVVLEGGKLAGVLLEMSAEGDRVQWVVAGVGLNVRRPPDALDTAAFVSDRLPELGVAAVTARVLDAVASAYREWVAEGFERMAHEFDARSVLVGREVRVTGVHGELRAQGRVDGVDGDGRLLVSTRQGQVRVAAGDVTLRE